MLRAAHLLGKKIIHIQNVLEACEVTI